MNWTPLLAGLAAGCGIGVLSAQAPGPATLGTPATEPVLASPAGELAQTLVRTTCAGCHNDRSRSGNLSFSSFEISSAALHPDVTEKMIRKLRAGQMPPAGVRRDEGALAALAGALEAQVDARGAELPPGRRTFQRLNRAEYQQSVRDLLAIDVNAGDYLPLDAKSANFDNIADAQLLSPTVMQGYLNAAAEISRLAVGDRSATAREVTYQVSRWTSQREHADGAPYGTRGGIAVTHTFPADGDYRFRVSFYHETTGALYGNGRAALLDIDRWMNTSDPDGVNLRTKPIAVTAGPHRLSAAFIRRFEGPEQDLISPLDWSIASTSIADAYGFTTLPHLRDLAVTGPLEVTGVSETPSRQRIFTCSPKTAPQQMVCAREIVLRLASQAFRRPVGERDIDALMALYRKGEAEGFESGVRSAIEGILASPRFIFRLEERPAGVGEGQSYALSDLDLASRLSFFLWSAGPDDELLGLAEKNRLSAPATLEAEVRRMLADRRSDVLAARFAAQWLRLQDLEKINPDVRFYPDFDQQLKDAMLRETELFFRQIVREDRSVMDLFTADYTFLNERLARHYGISNVVGPEFRKVPYPDGRRRGLLGQGSILTLTSHADRTSPVLRGKWVLEVLLGTPPPPPPPNVPDFDATPEAEDGRLRTVRERMEQHRANPACTSCHKMIDPLGLALENFDVVGAWRIKDNGAPVDASSVLYDGTPLTGPEGLRQALLKRSGVLLQTFTENLTTFALGRRLEPTDMPAIRGIVHEAAAADNRMSALVLGIVKTPAFRMKSADEFTERGR